MKGNKSAIKRKNSRVGKYRVIKKYLQLKKARSFESYDMHLSMFEKFLAISLAAPINPATAEMYIYIYFFRYSDA